MVKRGKKPPFFMSTQQTAEIKIKLNLDNYAICNIF